MFEFMACVEDKAKKRACIEHVVMRAVESEQVLKDSAPEELDTEDLVSECVGQVRRQALLIHRH